MKVRSKDRKNGFLGQVYKSGNGFRRFVEDVLELGKLGRAILLLPLLPLIAPFLLYFNWRKSRDLYHRARQQWLPRGINMILVYSDSPVWRDYIESNWLPRVGKAAIVLNWTHRKRWPELYGSLEREIYDHWAGRKNFNPLAICLTEKGKFEVIRFWYAFRDYKHGKGNRLKALEADLMAIAGAGKVL